MRRLAALAVSLLMVGCAWTVHDENSDRHDLCDLVVAQIRTSHDYTGTPAKKACVGQEDDPRVQDALAP